MVLPVNHAIQGYKDSPSLWEKNHRCFRQRIFEAYNAQKKFITRTNSTSNSSDSEISSYDNDLANTLHSETMSSDTDEEPKNEGLSTRAAATFDPIRPNIPYVITTNQFRID